MPLSVAAIHSGKAAARSLCDLEILGAQRDQLESSTGESPPDTEAGSFLIWPVTRSQSFQQQLTSHL
jgi:hypothetical protein